MKTMFIFIQRGTALLLSLILVACTTAPPQQTSDATTPATPPQNTQASSEKASASRIVALTSLSADIIYRLDKTKLIGIPGSRILNQPDLQKLPRVSEGRTQPNLEKIVALKPDLVVGAAGFHETTLKKLEAVGIRTILADVKSWQTLEALTKTLAQATATDPAPLLQDYKTFLSNVPNQTTSTLVLVSQKPILAPNKDSWAGDFLTRFKVRNVTASLQGQSEFQGYVTLSPEKVLQANPDVLILIETEPGLADRLKSQPFWNQLKAVQRDRVYVFDYYGLVNPGSIDKIEQACNQLKQILAAKP